MKFDLSRLIWRNDEVTPTELFAVVDRTYRDGWKDENCWQTFATFEDAVQFAGIKRPVYKINFTKLGNFRMKAVKEDHEEAKESKEA